MIAGNVIRVSLWVLLVGLLMSALTLANTPMLADAASNTTYKDKGKVCVKHKTGSKKNPYVYILVPKKAFYNGHKKHGDIKAHFKKCEKKGKITTIFKTITVTVTKTIPTTVTKTVTDTVTKTVTETVTKTATDTTTSIP